MSAAYQVRAPDDIRRIAELQEENSYLKRQLALEIDADASRLVGEHFGLTPAEAKVVALLLQAHGRTVTKGAILDVALGSRGAEDCKSVDVYVHRLRKKLGPSAVETVRARGHRLSNHFRNRVSLLLSERSA